MRRFIPFIFLLLLLYRAAYAQEEIPSPVGILHSGSVLLLKSAYPNNALELRLFDPSTTDESLYLNLRKAGYHIPEVRVDNGGRYIFTLEVEGSSDTGFVDLGPSQIVRLNLQTGEREIMFSGTNVTDFRLSPDSTLALLGYFPSDMTYVDRYDSIREQWCVVELGGRENDCHQIMFEQDTYPTSFEWVNNLTLAYLLNYAYAIQLLNAKTMTLDTVALPNGTDKDGVK